MSEIDAEVPLMTQGEWMKGCPEGSEQGFLFQLYTQLSNEACSCPSQCGYSIPRQKSLFFALYVCVLSLQPRNPLATDLA